MSNPSRPDRTGSEPISRRRVLRNTAGLAAAGAAALHAAPARGAEDQPEDRAAGRAVTRGNIKQSMVHWCFGDHWNIEQAARIAAQLGMKSVELVAPEHWGTLKEHGLTCAIANNGMPAPPFVKGFNQPAFHDELVTRTRRAIDACAEAGVPNVIAFTGYADTTEQGGGKVDREEGARNCVEGFKKIVGHAEDEGVTICLEMLNTRADDHPMKGHPGYQGDHTDYCIDILKEVGSERLKLLFDIYHVQIMDGDIIRRIHQHKDYIGHIHTAGNPGRGELDNAQEINYPPTMQALLDIGYEGYVGQEFIPTRDPLAGLREAVALCDV